MIVTPFHPAHFAAIEPMWFQREIAARVTPEYLANLAAEPSSTLWINGRPMAIAGVLGNCELWTHIDARIGAHKKSLVLAARQFLDRFGWLYANVDGQHREACRFLEHFGFARVSARRTGDAMRLRYERVMPCLSH
jgi:hypothetical protein